MAISSKQPRACESGPRNPAGGAQTPPAAKCGTDRRERTDYDFLMKKSTISDEELSISTLKYSMRLVR